MIKPLRKQKSSAAYRIFSAFICFTFISNVVIPPSFSQVMPGMLPVPGTMVNMSPGFTPTLIKGLTVHPENPLQFDFIVDSGDSQVEGEALKAESTKLIKYFLASLTVPEKDMWVNLSPYEKNRIIPEGFGLTEMGRDLLAQDYILKQLTASMIYPEQELGKNFWKRVRTKVQEKFGNTDIPMDTFNKIWIIPSKAAVLEYNGTAFVRESHLKVMLEEDYLARSSESGVRSNELSTTNSELTQIIREVMVPEIEKEVNEGKNFANLRQIYNAMILATWYKLTLKQSLLGQVYVDQNKVKGIDSDDPQIKQKIYDQYLAAFKKGVYNYIKEDYDPASQEVVQRKYFSGGAKMETMDLVRNNRTVITGTAASLSPRDNAMLTQVTQVKGRISKIDVDLIENPSNALRAQIAAAQTPDAAMLSKLSVAAAVAVSALIGTIVLTNVTPNREEKIAIVSREKKSELQEFLDDFRPKVEGWRAKVQDLESNLAKARTTLSPDIVVQMDWTLKKHRDFLIKADDLDALVHGLIVQIDQDLELNEKASFNLGDHVNRVIEKAKALKKEIEESAKEQGLDAAMLAQPITTRQAAVTAKVAFEALKRQGIPVALRDVDFHVDVDSASDRINLRLGSAQLLSVNGRGEFTPGQYDNGTALYILQGNNFALKVQDSVLLIRSARAGAPYNVEELTLAEAEVQGIQFPQAADAAILSALSFQGLVSSAKAPVVATTEAKVFYTEAVDGDRIFAALKTNGFINEQGNVTPKFTTTTKLADLGLPSEYSLLGDGVFGVLQRAERSDSAMLAESINTLQAAVTAKVTFEALARQGLPAALRSIDFHVDTDAASDTLRLRLGSTPLLSVNGRDFTPGQYDGNIGLYILQGNSFALKVRDSVLLIRTARDGAKWQFDVEETTLAELETQGLQFLRHADAAMLVADPAKIKLAPINKTSGKGQTEVVDLSKFEGDVGSGKVINPRSKQWMSELMTDFGSTYYDLMRERSEEFAAIERGEVVPGGKGDMDMDMVVEDAYGGQATVREILESDWKVDPVPEGLKKAGAILTGPWTPMMGISALSGREITDMDRQLYNEVLARLQSELPANLVAAIDKVALRKPDGQLATQEEKIAYVKSKLANVQSELATKNKAVPVRVFADLQDAKIVHGDGPLEGPQTISNIVNGQQPDVIRTRDGKRYSVPPRSEWPIITIRIDDMDVSDRHLTYNGQAIPDIISSLVLAVESIYEALSKDPNQSFALVIPKMQTPKEHVFVTKMIMRLQEKLGIKENISTIFMNETNEAARKLDVMLWVARHHVRITNVGRWDKGAADMRTFWAWAKKVYGDLAKVDMFKLIMDSYVRDNLVIANKRGAVGEGGMVTVMPSEGNAFPEDDKNAIQAIVTDKVYEWLLGYDFAWVASPSYLPLVQFIFQQPREFQAVLDDLPYAQAKERLLEFPEVPLTEEGIDTDVYEMLTYLFGYRNTGAAVAIDNLKNKTRGMFDGATGKKVNYHLWMLKNAASKLTGTETAVTEAYLDQRIAKVMADKGDRYRQFVPQSELDIATILAKALISSKNLVLWEKELMNSVVDDRDPVSVQKKVDTWLAKYNAEQDRIFGVSTGESTVSLPVLNEKEDLFSVPGVKLTDAEEAEAQVLAERLKSRGLNVPGKEGTTREQRQLSFARKAMSLRGTSIGYQTQISSDQAKMFREGIADPNKKMVGLGAISGRQAVMQVLAGAKVIYLSGWQGAGKQMLPDISSHSIDDVVRNAKEVIDAMRKAEAYYKRLGISFKAVPIVVDIDAGFGSPAKIFNLVLKLIEVGVGVVHIENQDRCEKGCGHTDKLNDTVKSFNNATGAVEMAFMVAGVDGVVIGRTDSEAASTIRAEADTDPIDSEWLIGVDGEGKELTKREAVAQGLIPVTNANVNEQQRLIRAIGVEALQKAQAEGTAPKFQDDEKDKVIEKMGRAQAWIPFRTSEGFFRIQKTGQKSNIEYAIETAYGYGDNVDLVWMETKTPSLKEAMEFAEAMHKRFPGKPLAYNLSPSFKWRKYFESEKGRKEFIETIKKMGLVPEGVVGFDWDAGYTADLAMQMFVPAINALGYKFQFITLAGFHAESYSMFDLADKFYKGAWMAAYSKLQEEEADALSRGYYAERHQQEVGLEFYEALDRYVKGGKSSRLLLSNSTETAQFGKTGGDKAMLSAEGTPVGGINLDPALLNLQIKRDGKGIPLPMMQQPIQNMKIDGFLPVIINVTPITSLPLLLGLNTEGGVDFGSNDSPKAKEPEAISYLN